MATEVGDRVIPEVTRIPEGRIDGKPIIIDWPEIDRVQKMNVRLILHWVVTASKEDRKTVADFIELLSTKPCLN